MSYTTMNAKFTSVDDVNTEKSVAQIAAAEKNRNVFLTGFLDWNSSTAANSIAPFLDEKGNPLQLPVGSVIRHVYLTQAGNDTSTSVPANSSLLAGATFVNVWLTNKNSSGAYAVASDGTVITPTQLGSNNTYTATTIGMSGTGFVRISGPVANKQVAANSKQATYICGQFTGAATNGKSRIQLSIRAVL